MPTKRSTKRAPVAMNVSPRGKPSSTKSATGNLKAVTRQATHSKRAAQVKQLSDSDHSNDAGEDSVDEYKYVYGDDDDDDNGAASELDSDALDEDSDVPARKRKRGPSAAKKSSRKTPARKRRKKDDNEEEEWDEEDVEEGQEVVGRVVQAPKTGRVPPGEISQNTFNFLSELKKPECNDREWFKLHEPVYRLAEKEWKDFIDKFTEDLIEVDPQIPPLPPKDVIHRIYRDVRFSNDKTPYKTGFSASFSRSGRKGIFAVYHVAIKTGGQSLLAAGSWCPGRNELQTIRAHILRSSSRLRRIISAPRFVELFGQPKPGARRSIFGLDDELKVAPKGIDKNHKDIDLLKCRSFAVVHYFSDEDVLKSTFRERLAEVVKVVRPLVHCLNDYITLPTDEEMEELEDDDDEGGEDAGDNDDDGSESAEA